jgi:hypothetical protein
MKFVVAVVFQKTIPWRFSYNKSTAAVQGNSSMALHSSKRMANTASASIL